MVGTPESRAVPRNRILLRSASMTVVACCVCIAAAGGRLLPKASDPEAGADVLVHAVSKGSLTVTVIEQGTVESEENTEIKCGVRGDNTVVEVVDSGTWVEPGDVLVRLDTLFIDEQIAERRKYALWTESGRAHTLAHFERSKLAVEEYRQGRYEVELMTLQKDLSIAEANLVVAESMLEHAMKMRENDYISDLDVRDHAFSVKQAKMAVELKKTEIDVLKNYTKDETLATLRGNMRAAEARFNAEDERLFADRHRLQRALDEKELCVILAEKAGIVIHPSAARWKDAPEIEEGATVYKDQILLLMPDLSKMQVKIGVHESIVDRVKVGLHAKVSVPDRTLEGDVSSVATVTSPAGWWTGNQVKYDTTIRLPGVEGLRPGMSAEVELLVAHYDDVLTVPVAAVLQTGPSAFCWVAENGKVSKREVSLGDTDDISIIVTAGLQAGDQVVLNPMATVDEARQLSASLNAEVAANDESDGKLPLPNEDTDE